MLMSKLLRSKDGPLVCVFKEHYDLCPQSEISLNFASSLKYMKFEVQTTLDEHVELSVLQAASAAPEFDFSSVAPLDLQLKTKKNGKPSLSIVSNSSFEDWAVEQAYVRLRVPQQFNIAINSPLADIQLPSKLEGDVRFHVGSGNISVDKIRGENISLRTSKGSIQVTSLCEGKKVSLSCSTLNCKRLMAAHASVELNQEGICDIGAIYSPVSSIVSKANGAITIGNSHGSLYINLDGKHNVNINGINGSIDLSSDDASNVKAHFDTLENGTSSSIFSLGNIGISVDPEISASINLHGDISIEKDLLQDHECEELEDNYQICSGTLKAEPSRKNNLTNNSGKISATKESAMTSSFYSVNGDLKSSTIPHLVAHSGGGKVVFEKISWMDNIKLKFLGSKENRCN